MFLLLGAQGEAVVEFLKDAHGIGLPYISLSRDPRHTTHDESKVTPGLPKEISFATYKVTYANISGENVETYLPFGDVLRVLRKPSLAVTM